MVTIDQEKRRARGRVKWFSDGKGFGFITPDEGSEDLFVHFSEIICKDNSFRTLKEGSRVSFEIGESPKGKQALKIEIEETA